MPRTVDHDARRAQITDALLVLAARDGLHAATMRAVAAEAGVSVRLLQYYFETKDRLVEHALAELSARSTRRWDERIAASPDPGAPVSVLRAFVDEALPTDEQSSRFQLLFLAHVAQRSAGAATAAEGPRVLRGRLAGAFEQLVPDAEREAAALLALVHGLGTGILIGLHGPDEAAAIAHAHLDRVLAPGRSPTD